ncbi:MAG: hypothetical protein GY950_30675 [bacterium]|nr:hypothetical protein [bacterium]
MNEKENFDWQLYPEAEQWVLAQLEEYRGANPGIGVLEEELLEKVGARLIDFVDYLVVDSGDLGQQLEGYGYVEKDGVWTHAGSALPRVVVGPHAGRSKGVAVKVDDIGQFLLVRGLFLPVDGGLYTRFRRCEISTVNDVSLWVVERRFSDTIEPVSESSGYLDLYFETLNRWRIRGRHFESDDAAVVETTALAERQVKAAGVDLAAYLFFEAEQEYFMSKNRAARLHKMHADKVGVGWANRDHHTYRNFREHYAQMLKFFLTLGFKPRERFYAGEEAGWGAQVMENSSIDVSLFLDVDISPEELEIDFFNKKLEFKGAEMRAAGFWSFLHGGSLAEAGLHHVAVRSYFTGFPGSFKADGIKMMEPFSTLPYLKQSFTWGEFWPVKEERIRKLLADGLLEKEAAERIALKGAVGSHVENIQRADGFKGFNKQRISDIIVETNPASYDKEG